MQSTLLAALAFQVNDFRSYRNEGTFYELFLRQTRTSVYFKILAVLGVEICLSEKDEIVKKLLNIFQRDVDSRVFHEFNSSHRFRL